MLFQAWVSSGNSAVFATIKDPNNNIAIEMHQYLNSDGSGATSECVSSTAGADRLQVATQWLKDNNLKGFLGELGAGNDGMYYFLVPLLLSVIVVSSDTCIAAIKSALCHMQTSGGVWLGALWWAAGPWWGTYWMSIEPPSGGAVARVLPEAWQAFL